MPKHWVVNSSPLILLAKINQQHLLPQLAESIVVPQGVIDEINAGPQNGSAWLLISNSPIPIVIIESAPEFLAWDLGAGETQVLSYALHRPGWKCCN